MATPSSSTTTPSPQPRYLQANAVAPSATIAPPSDSPDSPSERERAVQKFLARAELSKSSPDTLVLTTPVIPISLPAVFAARLSYATYKATHNLVHTTLHDLEVKVQNSPTPTPCRPAQVHQLLPNNPATQGPSNAAHGISKPLSRKGTMAPPASVTASATQSLYTSILAPPPAKRARTIHNPQDPPLPAAVKPKSTPSRSTRSSNTSQPSPTKPRSRKARIRENVKELLPTTGQGKATPNGVNFAWIHWLSGQRRGR
ncbi:hypothetical protein NLI96_g5626 [Meripilus lineatus]|uniref:Uncharacterized protein n=1 Tax=Meripilus lineatus TaxID=2056292 RepID=A0AAD5YIV0_9APHY|nr:hypothetical protein NLI96_g5626 [Physisporinus lineatus]